MEELVETLATITDVPVLPVGWVKIVTSKYKVGLLDIFYEIVALWLLQFFRKKCHFACQLSMACLTRFSHV